ncbi:MAG: YdcF family protein [Candidatus Parvarchaeum sp.]
MSEEKVVGIESKLNESLALYRALSKNIIVVLGGPNQDKRLEKGLELYKQDMDNQKVIISGFGDFVLDKSKSKNINLDNILYEPDSKNTEENAINSLLYIKESGLQPNKITLVSDYAHEPRSKYLFNKYKKRVFYPGSSVYDTDLAFSGIKTEDKLKRVVYEMAAFPLSFTPYNLHKKITEKYREYKA